MKKVFVGRNPLEAHVVRSLMESRGIEAQVRGEILFGLIGEVPVTPDTLPSTWILDDVDLGAALDIIAEFNRTTSREPPPGYWKCPRCGERIEPQFADCWRCSGV